MQEGTIKGIRVKGFRGGQGTRQGRGGGLRAGLRALRHRNYQLFFGGQLVSLTGSWIQLVAQSWLVYRMTDSAALLGAVAFAGQVPGMLLSPLGGALADRVSRQRILVVTQCCAAALALALAALTLAGAIQVWHVFAFAAVLGVVSAFDLPARQSFIADMVGREDLPNAIALNSSALNMARLVGPALAGLLVATVGEGWCFFANGVSYLAVISGLLLMKVEAPAAVGSPRPLLAHIKEGFRFVLKVAPVRALLALFALVTLMGMPYSVLMPILADRVLGAGPGGQGVLMAAAGCGALLGALSLVARREMRRLASWMAASSACFGASLLLFSLSSTFWLSAMLLVPVGFSMMLVMASSNTLLQTLVPDELRGRVMSVYAMLFLGAAPSGSLLAGWLSGHIGPQLTIAVGGVGCVLAALLFSLRLPSLRSQARRLARVGELSEISSHARAGA